MSNPKIVNHNRRFFRHLELRNFTAFGQATMDFVPQGLNVFVGENGTGKTHAMKVMYAWMLCQSFRDAQDWGFWKTLLRVMPGEIEAALIRQGQAQAEVDIRYGDGGGIESISQMLGSGAETRKDVTVKVPNLSNSSHTVPRPVFIPAVEMIGHTKGFGDSYDVHGIDFDYTFREIVRLLNVTSPTPAPGFKKVISKLKRDALRGDVEFDKQNDRFYLTQNGSRLPMPLVAEGLRKLATLHRLLVNGSIQAGTTLFWDEPEVNLNPKLMDELVDALLAIVRSGVQVFITTHSYVILEEIADCAKAGEVRYFGFEPGNQGVKVRAADRLEQLRPNPILDQYEDLSNRKLMKAFAPRSSE